MECVGSMSYLKMITSTLIKSLTYYRRKLGQYVFIDVILFFTWIWISFVNLRFVRKYIVSHYTILRKTNPRGGLNLNLFLIL